MQDEWLKADYFENFRCKCGACRNSCCEGWEIAVARAEYHRIIGMDCSPELHHRLECAFRVPEEVSPEHFRVISPNWLGKCPLHSEDGLCMLQVECGEAALTEVCRVYPRSMKRAGEVNRACCSNSCEAVVELLMRDEALRFSRGGLDARAALSEDADARAAAMDEACLWMIADRSMLLKARVRGVCALLGGESTAARVDAAAALRMLMRALEALRRSFFSLDRFGAAAFARYGGAAEAAYARFAADARAMEARFPAWEKWFENLLANHIFYMELPRADARLSAADQRFGLCALYAAMRALAAAHTSVHASQDDLADVLAGLFRMAEHSAFYYNMRVLIDDPLALTLL